MKDLYEILQVNQNASQEVIEKVYRFLAKKYHPDMNPQNRELMSIRMIEINKAFEILGNEFKRAEYDKMLRTQNANSTDYLKQYKKSFRVFISNAEQKIINVLFKVSFLFVIVFLIYLMFIYNTYNKETSDKNIEKEVLLADIEEIRSEGLWKDGINKEKTSSVLGKCYYNNIIQTIKLSKLLNNYGSDCCSSSYLLNKEYSLFSGTVGIEDSTKNSELIGRITIYGDENQLYKSQILMGGFEPHKFEIDVKNINRLQIRFQACLPEHEVGWTFRDAIKIGLFNGILIKK